MRIDGTDAASWSLDSRVAYKDPQDDAPVTKPDTVESNMDNKGFSQMTNLEKKEVTISDKAVIAAIEKANKAISGANRQFEFSIHKKTKQIMVKVIDSDTKEVIREIPPEKILDMVAQMWEMAGILVDERR